ncbi:hypothetical protein Hanom_Chr03g00204131 [Helianthus anomalus]
MELMSLMKMARFQPFGSRCKKNKRLYESRKTGQTLGTKWHFLATPTLTKFDPDAHGLKALRRFPNCAFLIPSVRFGVMNLLLNPERKSELTEMVNGDRVCNNGALFTGS